jgi:hypothetical protein
MTSSEKQPQPVSTEQPHDPLYGTGLRRASPEEARRLGHPIRNELIVHPVPRSATSPQR